MPFTNVLHLTVIFENHLNIPCLAVPFFFANVYEVLSDIHQHLTFGSHLFFKFRTYEFWVFLMYEYFVYKFLSYVFILLHQWCITLLIH